uniref:MADF domain-containing protein n=1 Tax=Sinocyclocheilus rhinocerous TaxID=307959 RepID=A0A673FZS5_9TELE
MDVEMLLSEHRELFDKSHTDYKNQDKKEVLWQRIAEKIAIDVDRLQKKKKKPWKFMKVMEFLAASTEPRRYKQQYFLVFYGDGSDSEQATCSSGASSTSSEPVQSSSKKRKQPDTQDFMERYLAAKEAREREERRELRREDNVSLFLQNLAPTIRRLPPPNTEYGHTDIPLSPQQPVYYHRAPPQTPPRYNNSANSWYPL